MKFQQPGDDQFLFNLVHASDSEASFAREIKFFGPGLGAGRR
jgi:nucleoside diphosphate kinase